MVLTVPVEHMTGGLADCVDVPPDISGLILERKERYRVDCDIHRELFCGQSPAADGWSRRRAKHAVCGGVVCAESKNISCVGVSNRCVMHRAWVIQAKSVGRSALL